MLSIRQAPDPDGLRASLAARLGWYLNWRRSLGVRDVPDLAEVQLFEVLPLETLTAGADLASSLRLLERREETEFWHVQLRVAEGSSWVPRFYARARRQDDEWRTLWIGERWLARAVHDALGKLGEEAGIHPDSTVRVLSSRLYQFTSLYIGADGKHLIAHASPPLRERLRLLSYVDSEQLRVDLLGHFGGRFEGEGIG